jgi:hypothetical protein
MTKTKAATRTRSVEGVVVEELDPSGGSPAPSSPGLGHWDRYHPSTPRPAAQPPTVPDPPPPRPVFDIPDGATNKVRSAKLLLSLDAELPIKLELIAAEFASSLSNLAQSATNLCTFITHAHQFITARDHQRAILRDAGFEAPDRSDIWLEVADLAAGNPGLLNQLRSQRAQHLAEQTAIKAQAADELQIGCDRVGHCAGSRDREARTYGRHTDSHWHLERFEEELNREDAAAGWSARLTTGTEREQFAATCQLSFVPIPDPAAPPSRR